MEKIARITGWVLIVLGTLGILFGLGAGLIGLFHPWSMMGGIRGGARLAYAGMGGAMGLGLIATGVFTAAFGQMLYLLAGISQRLNRSAVAEVRPLPQPETPAAE